MAEYIEKEKAVAYVEEQYRLFKGDESKQAVVEGCVEALKFTPTADVVEVKHGEWLTLDECANEGVYCLICHKKVYKFEYANQALRSPYCPNCGAKMDMKGGEG